MILDNCPICGCGVSNKKHSVKDFSFSKEVFDIVECERCKFLYTNPRPDSEKIQGYYGSLAYISHTNQRTGLFGKTYQYLRQKAIKEKEKWISKHVSSGSILDYGCGTGEFLMYCRTKGWSVAGIEIAEEPRKQAKENYNLTVLSPKEIDDLVEGQFNVATLWHVLEHMDSLRPSLQKIISKLNKEGLLVVALPNPVSWDAKYYKEFWAAWDVPIHFYHFKKEDVLTLFSSLGMELIEIKNMPYDAYYISLLSEQYKFGRNNWIKAFFFGAISNLKAGKNNASSLTYIFKKL